MDSGATDHLTKELDKLTLKEKYHGKDKVQVANGASLSITHIGQSYFLLLSIHRFATDNNVFFEFHQNFFLIKDQATKKFFLRGESKGGLCSFSSPSTKQVFSAKITHEDWRCRLGHHSSAIVQHSSSVKQSVMFL